MAKRFAHLDGLRGVAALAVMAGHSVIAFDYAIYTGNPAQGFGSWDVWLSGMPFNLVFTQSLAVCLFFAMSGFVLVGAFDGSPLGTIPLLVKRYLRLTIPIACICFLSYLLLKAGLMVNHPVATVSRSSWLNTQFQQPASLLVALKQGFTAVFHKYDLAHTCDGSLWTMPVEFAGSVGVLALCFLGRRLTPERRRFLYIALSAALYLVLVRSYLGLFAAGVLIRQLAPEGWAPLNRRPALAMILCLVGLFLGTQPDSAAPWRIVAVFRSIGEAPAWLPWAMRAPVFWHSVGAILILVGLQSWRPLQRFLNLRPIQWLGRVSFPLYLVHLLLLSSVGCGLFLACRAAGAPYFVSVAVALLGFWTISLGAAQILTETAETSALRFSGWAARKLHSSGVLAGSAARTEAAH